MGKVVQGIWYKVLGIWNWVFGGISYNHYRHSEVTHLLPVFSIHIERINKRYLLEIAFTWLQWCTFLDAEVTWVPRYLKLVAAAILTWLILCLALLLSPILLIVGLFMIHDAWMDGEIVDEEEEYHAWRMAELGLYPQEEIVSKVREEAEGKGGSPC